MEGRRSARNGLAIAAVVLAVPCWPLGVVLGHLGRRRAARLGGVGAGLAVVALVVSYTLAFVTFLLLAVWLGGAHSARYAGAVAAGLLVPPAPDGSSESTRYECASTPTRPGSR